MSAKRPGAGRPKGALNKENKQLREMILEALEKRGGVDYLAQQALDHPGPFMSLLAKVLPMQVTGENGDPLKASITVSFE